MKQRPWLFLMLLSMALLAFDQGIKAYIVDHIIPMQWSISIYPYGGIPVFQDWHGIDFSLNYAMNKGAAWGAFSSFSSALLYMRFLIIGALLSYLLFSKATFWKKLFLSLITTGAIGNVVDFFVYGHVVDMFHFCFWGYSFPVFNVADSAIFCGVAALLFQNVKGEKVAHDRSY